MISALLGPAGPDEPLRTWRTVNATIQNSLMVVLTVIGFMLVVTPVDKAFGNIVAWLCVTGFFVFVAWAATFSSGGGLNPKTMWTKHLEQTLRVVAFPTAFMGFARLLPTSWWMVAGLLIAALLISGLVRMLTVIIIEDRQR